jgi:hypothetical protein
MNEELLEKLVAEIEHTYNMENARLENLKAGQSGFKENLTLTLLAYNFYSFKDDFS